MKIEKRIVIAYLLSFCLIMVPARVFAVEPEILSDIEGLSRDEIWLGLHEFDIWNLKVLYKQIEDYCNSGNAGADAEKARSLLDVIESILEETDDFPIEEIYLEPEWEELDPLSDPYYSAIQHVIVCREISSADGFQLNAAYCYEEDNSEPGSTGMYSEGSTIWYLYDYQYINDQNEICEGQRVEYSNRGGSYISSGHLFIEDPNFQDENPIVWDLLQDIRNGEKGEQLNTRFIEYVSSLN